jgi:hypothetical protein
MYLSIYRIQELHYELAKQRDLTVPNLNYKQTDVADDRMHNHFHAVPAVYNATTRTVIVFTSNYHMLHPQNCSFKSSLILITL